MVRIPAGPFLMGTNNAMAYPADGEGPQRSVDLDEYWIDETTVTNLDFSKSSYWNKFQHKHCVW
jgi:formylglycine-generating enzyme required for sulfatase activity